MTSLFDGTEGIEDMGKIYDRMEVNCPDPGSKSRKLWKLRHRTEISARNPSKETMLERAVANLARRGQMAGWFNQCPAASGIGGSSRDRRRDVDLIHWDESNQRARLIELKWGSDDPPCALQQILRYGAAYLFGRVHRNKLLLEGRPLMDARHVSLEIAAPAHYYYGCDLMETLGRMRGSLKAFMAGSRIDGLTMSLDALAFPEDFYQIPFKNGEEMKQKCDTAQVTPGGGKIRDAFAGLTPVA